MSNENIISIIVPVYNTENYLRKCLDSIVNQTYCKLEIILIDDGSTDSSGAICDEYAKKDDRILVIHQSNKGQAAARNAGVDIANGEYIAFVDSDDIVEPQMLSVLIDMYKSFPDIELAICGYRSVTSNKIIIENKDDVYQSTRLTYSELWDEVFGKLNNAVWNKLYKRNLISDLRFPVDFVHGEDLIFNLEYISKCKSAAINQTPCYNYLQHSDSVTGRTFSNANFSEIKSKDFALSIIEKYNVQQIGNAKKYCFRARMNVLRAIYHSGKQNDYIHEIVDCTTYVKEHYKSLKMQLSSKERLEYFLFTNCRHLYLLAIKFV